MTSQASARRQPPIRRRHRDGAFTVTRPDGQRANILLCQGTGEWSALYIDGQLSDYGNHDSVIERLLPVLGIEARYGDEGDDAFTDPEVTVAETAGMVDRLRLQRQTREQAAAALEARAAEHDAEAERLRQQAAAERAALNGAR